MTVSKDRAQTSKPGCFLTPSHPSRYRQGCAWRGLFFAKEVHRGAQSPTHATLSSASISVNYSLVSSGIIQTASANVNELLFAYLFFSLLKCH